MKTSDYIHIIHDISGTIYECINCGEESHYDFDRDSISFNCGLQLRNVSEYGHIASYCTIGTMIQTDIGNLQ